MHFNTFNLFAAITPLAYALPHASTTTTTKQPACLDSVIALPQVARFTSLCTDKNVMRSAIETNCLQSESEAALSALQSLCAGKSASPDNAHSMSLQHRDLLSDLDSSLPASASGSSDANPATKSPSPLDDIASAASPASVIQGVESGIKTAPAALKSLESDVESAPVVGDVASMFKPVLDGVATAVSDAPSKLGSVVSTAPKALGGVVSAVADAPQVLGSVVSQVMATPTSTQHKHALSEISHPTASLASATRAFPAGHAVPTSALSRFNSQQATGTAPNAPLLTATGSPAVPKNGTVKPAMVPTTVMMHDGGKVTVTAPDATSTAAGSNNRAQATGAAVAVVAGLALLL